MSPVRDKDRFRALDSLRGICAIGVAIVHFPAIAISHVNDWPPVRNFPLFVDFFFVLSGFVISYAYWDRLRNWTELRIFALRRFARLWPLHIATLVPLVAINLIWLLIGHPAFRPPDNTWQSLLANLALVQSLGFFQHLTWNGQSWSISVEFYTYFVFAGLCLTIPRRLSFWASLGVIIPAATILLVRSPVFMETASGLGFFRCLFGFFTGQCAYFMWRAQPFTAGKAAANAAEVAMALFVTGLLAVLPEYGHLPMFAPAVFGVAIYIFSAEAGVISRTLLKPFPRLLGRLSYSIYLTHMLVLALMGSPIRHLAPALATNKLAGDFLLCAYLVATVALSWCTFRWIEKPGTRIFGPRQAPHLPG